MPVQRNPAEDSCFSAVSDALTDNRREQDGVGPNGYRIQTPGFDPRMSEQVWLSPSCRSNEHNRTWQSVNMPEEQGKVVILLS